MRWLLPLIVLATGCLSGDGSLAAPPEPSGEILVVVHDDQGEPIAGQVVASDPDGRVTETVSTGTDGTATLRIGPEWSVSHVKTGEVTTVTHLHPGGSVLFGKHIGIRGEPSESTLDLTFDPLPVSVSGFLSTGCALRQLGSLSGTQTIDSCPGGPPIVAAIQVNPASPNGELRYSIAHGPHPDLVAMPPWEAGQSTPLRLPELTAQTTYWYWAVRISHEDRTYLVDWGTAYGQPPADWPEEFDVPHGFGDSVTFQSVRGESLASGQGFRAYRTVLKREREALRFTYAEHEAPEIRAHSYDGSSRIVTVDSEETDDLGWFSYTLAAQGTRWTIISPAQYNATFPVSLAPPMNAGYIHSGLYITDANMSYSDLAGALGTHDFLNQLNGYILVGTLGTRGRVFRELCAVEDC